MNIHKARFPLAVMCALLASQAYALGISGTTTMIESENSDVVVEIDNPDKQSAHLITLSVVKIDSPYEGNETGKAEGEILFTPARMLLAPGQKQNVKFIYKGAADAKERYYAVRWHDEVLSGAEQSDDGKLGQVMAVAKVSTVLLVQPREARLGYKFDKHKGILHNTGNLSFKAVAHGPCVVKPKKGASDLCQQSRYIAPGRAGSFKAVKLEDESAVLGYWHKGALLQVER